MGIFNQKYSPLAQQIGQQLYTSPKVGMGNYSAFGQMLKKLAGGFLMGQQATARRKAEDADAANITRIMAEMNPEAVGQFGVKMEQPSQLASMAAGPPPGPMAPPVSPEMAGSVFGGAGAPPGPPPGLLGAPEGAVAGMMAPGGPAPADVAQQIAEGGGALEAAGMTPTGPNLMEKAALQKKGMQDMAQAYMDSEIPERRKKGMEMMTSLITAGTAPVKWEYKETKDGSLRALHPNDPTQQMLLKAPDPGKRTAYKPGDVVYDADGKHLFDIPKDAKAPELRTRTKTTLDENTGRMMEQTFYDLLDADTGMLLGTQSIGGLSEASTQMQEGPVKTDAVVNRKRQNIVDNADYEEARLTGILDTATPDLFGLEGLLKKKGTGLLDWFGVINKLPEDDQVAVRDYISRNENFLPSARRALNEYIRSVTGAVMNETEIYRIVGSYINEDMGYDAFMSRGESLLKIIKRDRDLVASKIAGADTPEEAKQIATDFYTRAVEEAGGTPGGGEEQDGYDPY